MQKNNEEIAFINEKEEIILMIPPNSTKKDIQKKRDKLYHIAYNSYTTESSEIRNIHPIDTQLKEIDKLKEKLKEYEEKNLKTEELHARPMMDALINSLDKLEKTAAGFVIQSTLQRISLKYQNGHEYSRGLYQLASTGM